MRITIPTLNRQILRVTRLEKTEDGKVISTTIHKKRSRKKKVSKWLRGIEKATRRAAKAHNAFAQSYLARHNRSNNKRRDGWLRNLPVNLIKAGRRGTKQLKGL